MKKSIRNMAAFCMGLLVSHCVASCALAKDPKIYEDAMELGEEIIKDETEDQLPFHSDQSELKKKHTRFSH